MPYTIDGVEVTAIAIDGVDVSQMTVDGVVVFEPPEIREVSVGFGEDGFSNDYYGYSAHSPFGIQPIIGSIDNNMITRPRDSVSRQILALLYVFNGNNSVWDYRMHLGGEDWLASDVDRIQVEDADGIFRTFFGADASISTGSGFTEFVWDETTGGNSDDPNNHNQWNNGQSRTVKFFLSG